MLDDRHLRRMTDDVGMLQFSKSALPDSGSGYTLDDNARALMVALFNRRWTRSCPKICPLYAESPAA
ncbi:MAG: hypothetical protein ACOX0Q_09645 [Syntrophomonadaceae bacterium]